MDYKKDRKAGQYGCQEYRQEMILVGLKKRLALSNLTKQEKATLTEEIARLEKEMGL